MNRKELAELMGGNPLAEWRHRQQAEWRALIQRRESQLQALLQQEQETFRRQIEAIINPVPPEQMFVHRNPDVRR